MRVLPDAEPPAPHLNREAALTAVFESHVDDIYRFCLARSGDPAMAGDVTGEVFLAAARAFAEGGDSKVTKAWLVTVAKSRLIDQWRSSSRHQRRIERLAERGPSGSDPDGDPAETAAIDSVDVIEALQSLPDRQRAALSLRYLEERSVSEIADHLDISYQAAESLLARSRASFERAWHNRNADDDEGRR